MRDDDSRWIGRFPMVKAVKRAMDASEEFLAKRDLSTTTLDGRPLKDGLKPDGFFVTGASKRGWTTWLIAAVDSRVKAICPIVIDVLNMKAQTPHHWASYGFWAPALKDYVANGIDKKFDTPELAKVMVHEDPLAYMPFLERLPKLIVTASGDEFFPTDSFQHYEKLLKGEWRLRTVPNAGHNLAGSAAPLEILAFYRAVTESAPRPSLSWSLTPGDGAGNIYLEVAAGVTRSVRRERPGCGTLVDGPSLAGDAVDRLAQQVEVTEVAGVLLDEMQQDPPQRHRLTPATPVRGVVETRPRRHVRAGPPHFLDPGGHVEGCRLRSAVVEVAVAVVERAVEVVEVVAQQHLGEPVALHLGEMPHDAQR